ncbi:MAG: IS21 family transposase [Firmicutes bacterium]|nr:IS21 family transposase [Bacillota bacterium]
MINLDKKRKILLMHYNEYNISQISREVGSARKTVRRYIAEYEAKLEELSKAEKSNNKEGINALVEQLSSKPKYNTSNRQKTALTDDVTKIIEECLEKNEEKIKNRNRKQIMKNTDIHELLESEGYEISYTSVCNYIREFTKKKEAYIKQHYEKAQTVEFDWGEVKLKIGGKQNKYQLALFSTAYGSYHFAILYNNQKMESFLDSHVQSFKHFGGVYKEVVYDNMKVAVKKFIGPTKKEATEDLMKISMYYGFDYRFCNARRGNEKGHVERGVEYVRRKAFSSKDEFDTLEEANKHLVQTLDKLNNKPKKWMENKSAAEKLNEEKEFLLPSKPDYVIARQVECRVDKYSTVTIEKNRYSIPEYLVGKFVDAKVYTGEIKISYKGEVVANHKRSFKLHDWTIDINHYLNTIKKKPGSLKNSVALRCSDHRLKNIYYNYYTQNPKEFIELLQIIKEKNLEKIENAIKELEKTRKRLVTTENIKNLVNQDLDMKNKDKKVEKTKNEIEKHSLNMLNAITDIFEDRNDRRLIN